MDTFLIKATQLILAFAILVIIHEFGHFLFARLFGVRVNKFYMFFNPWTSIFKWRPKKYVAFFGRKRHFDKDIDAEEKEVIRVEEEIKDRAAAWNKQVEKLNSELRELKLRKMARFLSIGSQEQTDERIRQIEEETAGLKKRIEEAYSEAYRCRAAFEERNYYNEDQGKKRRFWKNTEYGIGWLPLGGYCQIAGMIDESMDAEQMKRPAQDWEFRSKPAWQRLLIMVAGVLFNFLLAILIYAGIVYTTGEKYVPFHEAKMGMAYSDEAHKIGFRDGDIPLSADGEALDYPPDARVKMIDAKEVKVLRDGRDTIAIAIPPKFIFRLEEESKRPETMINFMAYRIPTRITQITPGEGAGKAGIKEGDEVIALNGSKVESLNEFLAALKGHENENIDFSIVRHQAGRTDTLSITVPLNSSSKIGVGLEINPDAFYNYEEKHYNIFESVPRGVEMGVDKLSAYASSMKLVFTKEGAKSIGGFGAIGSIFPESWDWIAFWNIAAFLSVALAFMNILPIPALDGGHVLFLLYEVIFHRKPSEKFLERAQVIGMILLLLLLVYANGMDIVRLFK